VVEGQSVQHRQDGSDADARREQRHGCVVIGEYERPARGGCFDDVASVQMRVEPGAGRAVVFAFDADPVLGGIGGMRTPICAAPRASCRR
jgi:hypothetical protein